MNQQIRIAYLIKESDSLNKIANSFGTSSYEILKNNKHITENKLHTDELISIVPCTHINNNTKTQQLEEQLENLTILYNILHKRFGEMLFWSYAYIISSLDETEDITYVQNRVARIPKEIANIFRPYYPVEEVQKIEDIIIGHFLVVTNLISALKRGSQVEYDLLNKELYKNADEFVNVILQLNPSLNEELFRSLLYDYIDSLKKIMSNRNNQTFVQEMINVDAALAQILLIANYLALGLSKQFSDRF